MKVAESLSAAVDYARGHGLHALVAVRGDQLVVQEFADGFGLQTPHPLYSGTKSFWGTVAVCARDDGLLELDEPVSQSIAAWRDDAWKRRVTVRMLLSLTAGFGFGGLGASVPSYERAVAMPLRDEPGSRFTYGGLPLQVFGAVLTQKLSASKMSPHAYLRERILEPAGVAVSKWRTLSDGTQPLPTGAFLSAADWLAYGRFVMRERVALAPCFEGSSSNPRYGLGWWLGGRGAPTDCFYASGSAGQALYVIPSQALLVVHFGRSSSYRHEAFLRRFFA